MFIRDYIIKVIAYVITNEFHKCSACFSLIHNPDIENHKNWHKNTLKEWPTQWR